MGSLFSSDASAPPELREKAIAGFTKSFAAGDDEGKPTTLGVAPGRAEVVGNHTDYNEGLVLACAIDRFVVLAGRCAPEGSLKCRFASESFPDGIVEVDLAAAYAESDGFTKIKQVGKQAWANYLIGVVSELAKLDIKVCGFDTFVASDVPSGGGVSSSAALEMATCKLLARLCPESVGQLEALNLVKVSKAAENNFVGMGCGILDQYCSGMGRANSLLCLDCRTVSHEIVPFSGAHFVLANTNAPHALVDGKYDELRKNCFAAAEVLKKAMGDEAATHLRDVSVEALEKHKGALTAEQLRHAMHIVHENRRVVEGVAACKAVDMVALGALLSESHASSRDSFQNSSRELDIMHRCAEGIEGHLGSRLMGGGFGGSTINLVREDCLEGFMEELRKRYHAEVGIEPTIWALKPGDGAFSEDL